MPPRWETEDIDHQANLLAEVLEQVDNNDKEHKEVEVEVHNEVYLEKLLM